MPLYFKYEKDKKYFADLLADNSITTFEMRCSRLFDFRNANIKRMEYNTKKPELFSILYKRAKGKCQICKLAKGTEIDHIIPLASNLLNKQIRKMHPVRINGTLKKVPSESYGSNHLANLQLACKPCNRKKWHRFFSAKNDMNYETHHRG